MCKSGAATRTEHEADHEADHEKDPVSADGNEFCRLTGLNRIINQRQSISIKATQHQPT